MAGKYVTYWDTGQWICAIEIMLAKSTVSNYGYYRLQVYGRSGNLLSSTSDRVNLFETKRVNLNDLVGEGPGVEGLVMVSDDANEDDEFVCVLKIMGRDQEPQEGIRYVPFTRIE